MASWFLTTDFDPALKKQLLRLKGAHRVQRVSATEKNGRRHTSTIMVLAVESASTAAIEVKRSDVKEEFYKASGAGGQHRNKTSSAVRLTHLPTNIVAISADERKQSQNREIAWERLKMKVKEYYTAQIEETQTHERLEQMTLANPWVWTDWRDEVKTPSGKTSSMKQALKGRLAFIS